MERILVIGGNGFIGSHVIDNLRARGLRVTSFDRFRTTPHRGDVDRAVGDIKDPGAVSEVVSAHDGLIHLAATLGTQETIQAARFAVDVNIKGALHVFDACRAHRKRAVITSVGNHWMNNPYSITKSGAERFALTYNRYLGTSIAVVRGLNAYGPRQKAKPVRKVVPNFVLPAFTGADLMVYGSGRQIMDMIYVEDLAEILVRALLLDHGTYDRVMEAGMGKDTTINELAELVIQTAGSASRIRHVDMRPGEEPDSVVKADVSSLSVLGFTSNDFTPLAEGMRRTVEWYRDASSDSSAE